MVAYTKPKQMKKEESERIREERDQIKFIDLRLERWQVCSILKSKRNARRSVNCMLLGMNEEHKIGQMIFPH